MVMTAGCAGWGTDGPTDPEEETDSNGEAQAEEDSDGAEDKGTETPDDTASTSEGDTEAQDSSKSSDATSDTSQSDGSSSDKSTDETGATGNGDSQTDTDGSEDDSNDREGADESDSDSSDSPEESDGEGSSEEDDSQDDSNGTDESNDDETDDEETHTLTVQVHDPEGESVEGADVSIVTYDGGESVDTGTTDENGEFQVEVPNGDYEVSVTGTEYAQSSANRLIAVQDGDTTFNVHLYNPDVPGSEPHTLTVNVISPEGNPVEDAPVSVVSQDGDFTASQGTTDEKGQVMMEVPEGQYEIVVDTSDMQFVDDETHEIEMDVAAQEYTVQLSPPPSEMYDYSATVQVVDEDGNPISNELVTVTPRGSPGSEQYITDENGEFTIPGGSSAEGDAIDHEVEVRGEIHNVHLVMGSQHEQITVSSDADRETHELTVNAGERVGVEGVDVTIERWDGQTTTKTTGEDGQVTFDVYPGEYTVTGVDDRGEEQSVDVTVPHQQEILLDDVAYPAPDEVETTLRVIDQNGDPVEGVTVEAITSIPPHYADVYIQSEPTDENGEVVVEAHAGQNYSIDRIEDADGTSYQVVSVGDGMTLEIDEDGESDEIVIERPTEDAQASYAIAAL